MTKPLIRIFSLVLCLACMTGLVLPVAAAPGEAVAGQTMTTTVRNGAGKNAAVIGQMEDGTAVTVLGERGDYYKVDCYDLTGYIAKSQIRQENDTYYVNCAADSADTRLLTYTDHADALMLRHSLMALAKEQLGKPYIYGSIGTRGFDCSGLTYYLFGQHGISLNRTASQQLQNGIVVPKEAMQVGDLVFFRESGCAKPASHVGIYVGNNQMIHAGSRGIEYADLDMEYYAKYYLCARRIVNTGAASLEEVSVARTVSAPLSVNSVSGRTVN